MGAALSGVDPTDPGAVWRALGAAGIVEALYPDGVQPDPRRLSALLTELDARCPLGVTLSVCVQVATVLPLLAGATGPAERARRGMLRGETVVALAVTDSAGSGSDLLDAATRVKLGDDGAVLDGGKDWITNATSCDAALVLARHREARHFTSFCWVLVPADAPGVTVGSAGRAFAGSGVGHLCFAGVALGPDAVLGRPGRALAGFARQVGVKTDSRGAVGPGDVPPDADGPARLAAAAAGRDGHAVGPPRGPRAVRPVPGRRAPARRAVRAAAGRAGGRPVRGRRDAAEGQRRRDRGPGRRRGGAPARRGRVRDGGEAQLRTEAAMFGIAGGATGAMLAGIADHADELAGAVT